MGKWVFRFFTMCPVWGCVVMGTWGWVHMGLLPSGIPPWPPGPVGCRGRCCVCTVWMGWCRVALKPFDLGHFAIPLAHSCCNPCDLVHVSKMFMSQMVVKWQIKWEAYKGLVTPRSTPCFYCCWCVVWQNAEQTNEKRRPLSWVRVRQFVQLQVVARFYNPGYVRVITTKPRIYDRDPKAWYQYP